MTTTRTGTETVTIKCRRCGGAGQREEWRNTGRTCFNCGGCGTEVVTRVVYAEIQMSEERRALHGIEQGIEHLVGALADARLFGGNVEGELAYGARLLAQELFELRESGKVSREAVVKLLRAEQRRDYSGTHGARAHRDGALIARAIVDAGKAFR